MHVDLYKYCKYIKIINVYFNVNCIFFIENKKFEVRKYVTTSQKKIF